jgi:hypothetical protein
MKPLFYKLPFEQRSHLLDTRNKSFSRALAMFF